MAIKVCTNTTEDMKNTLMPTDGKFQKTWFGIATIQLIMAQMCEQCQTCKLNVTELIKHIFEDRNFDQEPVVRKIRTTDTDGK